MDLVQQRLAFQQIQSPESSLLTTTADTLITQIVLCNTHTSSVTVHFAITSSSASVSTTSQRIFNAMTISANETMMLAPDILMSSNEKLWAYADVGNKVNTLVTGIVESV